MLIIKTTDQEIKEKFNQAKDLFSNEITNTKALLEMIDNLINLHQENQKLKTKVFVQGCQLKLYQKN